MKKILTYIFIGILLTGFAYAAPLYRLERSIYPEMDSTHELGSSTRAWLKVTTDELCLTADTCETTWPAGGPGSGIDNVVEDLTPQLGGNLDMNGKTQYDATYNPFGFRQASSTYIDFIRPIGFGPAYNRLSEFTNVKQSNTAITGGVGISGATYVPGADLLFMVDNNAVNVSIYRASNLNSAEFGNITFSGISDPESLTLLWTVNDIYGVPDKAIFATAEENTNQIVIFEWDLQSTSGTIIKASSTVIDATNMYAEDATLGTEAIVYIPYLNSILMCKQSADECRMVPLDGSLTPAATEPFDAATVWSGITLGRINDMTYDPTTRTVIAIGDETSATNVNQDTWRFDPISGVISEYNNNYIASTSLSFSTFAQSEGISITPDGETLYVTSEGANVAALTRGDFNATSYFNGNVGIGTTSPFAKLSVNGQVVGSHFTSTTTTANTFPNASTTALSVGTAAFFPGSGVWNSSGNLGVGSSSPSTKAVISGTTTVQNVIATSTATSTFGGAITVGSGSGTSTFAAGLSATALNITGSATSTFAQGINIASGCFAVNGVCVGGSGGAGTVTSVAQTVPVGFTVAGSPVTTSGTLAISYDTGFEGLKTASSTNWNSFYDTPSTRITAGTGVDWSGNTINGVYTAGDGITLNTEDFDCDTASGSVFGCLSSTDWNTFNNKVSSQWTTTGSDIYYNTGNVGIGTSTPYSKLSVNGQVVAANYIGTTTASSTFAGAVGIGTTSPVAKLSVQTSGVDTGAMLVGNVNSFFQSNIQNLNSGGSASSDWVATANNGSATTHYIDMGINGSGGGAAPFTAANDAYLYAIDDSVHIGALGTSSEIQFYTTGGTSAVFRGGFEANGNFGIGTTTPWGQLSASSTSSTAPTLAIQQNGTGPAATFIGKVGIGTTSPFASLSVGSTTSPTSYFVIDPSAASTTPLLSIASSTGTSSLAVYPSGTVFAPNTLSSASSQTGYWCYDTGGQLIRVSTTCLVSASKYKHEIHNLELGLEELLKLRPVSYYKKNPLDTQDAGKQIGFIADEVAAISPEVSEALVVHDSNGEIQAFRYEQFTALITKSIQELNAKIDNVKRSAEENWQWAFIGLLILGLCYQQRQINQLKR